MFYQIRQVLYLNKKQTALHLKDTSILSLLALSKAVLS